MGKYYRAGAGQRAKMADPPGPTLSSRAFNVRFCKVLKVGGIGANRAFGFLKVKYRTYFQSTGGHKGHQKAVRGDLGTKPG